MKSKWALISSLIQLVIGSLAVLAFICLAICGEDMRRWIVTLILAVFYVVIGIWGLVDYSRAKKEEK